MHRTTMSYRIRILALGIVAVTTMAAIGMTSSCLPDTRTAVCNGAQSEIRCPQGWSCTRDQDACTPDNCGNGRLDPGEICDDGNNIEGDGCSAHCQSDETCGNGITDIAKGEKCDGEPTCMSDCQFQRCGNTTRDPGEDCDEGRETQGCDADCTSAICGDGYTNVTIEQCDGGNFDTTSCNGIDAGSAACHTPVCGDGHINTAADENCETMDGMDSATCNSTDAGSAACHTPVCGDGYFNSRAEVCDTPDGQDSATCNGVNAGSAACQTPECGDGHFNSKAEVCDTLDGLDSAICNGKNAGSASCLLPECGDSHFNSMAEVCDTPDGQDSATCNGKTAGPVSCLVPKCRDGYFNSEAEVCEPGVNEERCNSQEICDSTLNPMICDCLPK